MSEKMPDWGVPNWRDGKAHQIYSEASRVQSRWEYLRREHKYRDDWLAETHGGSDERFTWSVKSGRYGLSHLFNPARSFFNESSGQLGPDAVTPPFNAIEPIIMPWEIEDYLDTCSKNNDRSAGTQQMYRHAVAAALDHAAANLHFVAFLDPFVNEKEQFERLKKEMQKWRSQLYQRKRADTTWRANFPLYLRLIDAKDAEVSIREITDQLSTEDPDLAYEESRIRKIISQARNASCRHIGMYLSRSE